MRSLMEDEARPMFDIGPNGMGLDLLRMVYRNPSVELSMRLRCAMACLPFETPKLLATAIIQEGNFAELLDKRIRHMQELEKGKLIEARSEPDPVTVAEPVAVTVK